jgi:hypothetical protein
MILNDRSVLRSYKTITTAKKIGEIVGKQKPGLFSALTLGLALLIAASALTASNNSESSATSLEGSTDQALFD